MYGAKKFIVAGEAAGVAAGDEAPLLELEARFLWPLSRSRFGLRFSIVCSSCVAIVIFLLLQRRDAIDCTQITQRPPAEHVCLLW
jgi:hypothetical protein